MNNTYQNQLCITAEQHPHSPQFQIRLNLNTKLQVPSSSFCLLPPQLEQSAPSESSSPGQANCLLPHPSRQRVYLQCMTH